MTIRQLLETTQKIATLEGKKASFQLGLKFGVVMEVLSGGQKVEEFTPEDQAELDRLYAIEIKTVDYGPPQ